MRAPAIVIDHGASKLNGVSVEEWRARVELAACYRIFAHIGWTEMIYNHITLRVPGREKHLLINPFGLHYSEITASNLVKIDLAAISFPTPNGPSIPRDSCRMRRCTGTSTRRIA